MNHIRSRSFWLGIGLLITDGLFFGLTNPVKVASIIIIVGFMLLLLSLYWVTYNLQKVLSLYAPWLQHQKKLSLCVVLVLGVLIALQSIGQLTARDAVLVTLAAIVLYAYTAYGKKQTVI